MKNQEIDSLAGKATASIRRATANDAPRLAELSAVLGYPVETEVMARRLARLLAHPQHLVLVAETSDNLVVGWIQGREQDVLVADCFGEIVGLVVAADHRGRGLGRRLVEEVERWARTRGFAWVSVRSNIVRTESHPFYERAGYIREKTQHAYRKYLR
jgi:ribosomal protein S18 acetylase RimI-like enzyme